jgi:hypothetical protein
MNEIDQLYKHIDELSDELNRMESALVKLECAINYAIRDGKFKNNTDIQLKEALRTIRKILEQ